MHLRPVLEGAKDAEHQVVVGLASGQEVADAAEQEFGPVEALECASGWRRVGHANRD